MSDLAAILPELRRPFPAALVQWKIQRNPKPENNSPAIIVGFIDARVVSGRLNQVCPGQWSHRHAPPVVLPKGSFVACELTVCGSSHTDVGWSAGAESDINAKTMYSDALKRAAVHFGVAVSLYELPDLKRWPDDLKSYGQGERAKWILPDQTKKSLDEGYEEWLARPGVTARFGLPVGSEVPHVPAAVDGAGAA